MTESAATEVAIPTENTPVVPETTVFKFTAPPKRPEKEELEKQCEAIQLEIDQLQDQLHSIKSQIEKIVNEKSGSKGGFDAAKAVIQKLYNEKKQLSLEKAQMMATRDAVRDSLQARINQDKQLRTEMKFVSADAIDSQIKDLETRQATTSMSLQDEKKIIKDIKTLQQSKKIVSQLAELKAAIDKEKESKAALDKTFSEKSAQVKDVNDRIAAQRAILDNLNKDTTGNRELIPALRSQEQVLFASKNQKQNKIRELRNQFKVSEDIYYKYLKEERARKQEARKKEMEERKVEEEERRKALEAEELAKVPYEDDMALCDYLVTYLEKTFPVTGETPTETVSESTAPVVDNGMRVLKRDLDDAVFKGWGDNSQKRGKKKGGSNKTKDTIVHGVDTIDYFASLGVTPPSTITAVPQAIETLKKKKEIFQTTERGVLVSISDKNKMKKTDADTATSKVGGKKGNGFSLEADFPTLNIGGKVMEGGEGVGPTVGWGIPTATTPTVSDE